MKAITLWQPWASLMVIGAKRNETRCWPPPERWIGDWIAIHAAMKFEVACEGDSAMMRALIARYGRGGMLPTGAVLGAGKLARVERTEAMAPSPLERECGDYGPGRFAWVFEDMRMLRTPVEVRGAQGLWNLPGQLETFVRGHLRIGDQAFTLK